MRSVKRFLETFVAESLVGFLDPYLDGDVVELSPSSSTLFLHRLDLYSSWSAEKTDQGCWWSRGSSDQVPTIDSPDGPPRKRPARWYPARGRGDGPLLVALVLNSRSDPGKTRKLIPDVHVTMVVLHCHLQYVATICLGGAGIRRPGGWAIENVNKRWACTKMSASAVGGATLSSTTKATWYSLFYPILLSEPGFKSSQPSCS